MSLPVDSVRRLVDGGAEVSVAVTLNVMGSLENRTYPGCYATWSAARHTPGAELLVFAYEDGRGAPPRARWLAAMVLGTEHYGDHVTETKRPPVAPAVPTPTAGPDYPAVLLTPGAGVLAVPLSGQAAPSIQKQIDATQSFPPVEEETPPGTGGTEESSSPVSDQENSSLSEKIEKSDFWQPEEPVTEEEGWSPRTRPTAHRQLKELAPPRRSPRGAAKRAVRDMGTVLLLGFALLGYNRNF